MKKIISLILVVLVISAIPIYGINAITVLVNGKQVQSETPAVIVSGTTMLPFRAIFNALGVEDSSITWNSQSNSIEINSDGKYIFLLIGNTGAIINSQLVTLPVAPYINNGRTLVPVRFVSEALNARVEWDSATRTVVITK